MGINRISGHVLIIGGSSGIGLALAQALLHQGTEVTIASRSPERLRAVEQQLTADGQLHTLSVDISQEAQVAALFAATGRLDHIAVTAVDVSGPYSSIAALDASTARRVLDSKIFGALFVAKHGAPQLAERGSITLTSGIAARRPAPRGAVVAAANGALESLVYALSLELAPRRVNAVSPGWVDTPVWDALAGDNKAAIQNSMAQRLPVGRIADPVDLADAFISLMMHRHITGTVLHVDGGQRLV
jgi:NAD(P)-dependent dehydrogenase (short-subunit alcohol dehydrogenase family)